MKLVLTAILFTLVACGAPDKDSNNEKGMDPQISLDVMNDYVKSGSALRDPAKWVKNNKMLSPDFKKAYDKMIAEAYKDDPEMGLGFDPILNAQDFPEKGFEIKSVDSKKGLITLRGIDWPEFVVATKLAEVKGEWLLDGAGVIRMSK